MNQGLRMVHSLRNCNQFSCPFLVRCGFWPLVQWYVYPWSSQSFTKERTAGVSSRNITLTNKSNCLTYTVASSLVCTSPLAVITVVGLLDGLQLSTVKVSLADHMHTRSRVHHKPCFLRLFCWRSREHPLFRRRIECSIVPFFEHVNISEMIPSLAFGTSLLSFSLFMGPLLQFHSVGTALMLRFDLCLSKRWSFLFPDTCLTLAWAEWTVPFESVPWLFFIGFHRGCFPLWRTNASESCETQPNCGTIFTIATALLSSLSLLVWE